MANALANASAPPNGAVADGLLLAQAFPERIAKARGGLGEFRLAGGRGVFLDPFDSLAREPWLAVGELGGGAKRERILMAAQLDPAALEIVFGERMSREVRLTRTPSGGWRAMTVLALGELLVEEKLVHRPDPALITAALLDEVRYRGLHALPFSESTAGLRARISFLGARGGAWPDLSDEALVGAVDDWLKPLLLGKTALADLESNILDEAIRVMIPWNLQRRLDHEAPARWTAPTGSSFSVDYEAEGGPRVRLRVQELFGLTTHPTVGKGVPLALGLLSPAHREIQVTRDLPGFWAGSWRDLRKDMRGRYPKHAWPEDPVAAQPTTRAKPRT